MSSHNLAQVLRNKPTKMAYLFVPEETEMCQKECGIAQMWATLFWSSQIALSLGFLHIFMYKSSKVPFVPIAIFQKILVGLLLIKAHMVCTRYLLCDPRSVDPCYSQEGVHPLHSQNGVVHSPPAMGGVLDLVMACILLFDLTLPPTVPTETTPATSTTKKPAIVQYLVQFAAEPWYPWVVGALSGLNNFVMVLSAPLVVLFLSGVLANPKRRYVAAFANAVGTTIGVAALVYLLTHNRDYIKETFPTVFEHPTWDKTKIAIDSYGWVGAFIISIQPVFLQPLVAVCSLANMSNQMLLGCVLCGRTVKYIIMAELAYAGDKRLGFFGSAALNAAEAFDKDANKDHSD